RAPLPDLLKINTEMKKEIVVMKIILIALLDVTVVRVAAEVKLTSLLKITDLNLALHPINITTYSVTLGSCALNCRNSQKKCCSFYYNKATRLCTMGYWIIPSQTTRNEMTELYSLGLFCDPTNASSVCTRNKMSCDSNDGFTLSIQTQADPMILKTFCNTTANFKVVTKGGTTVCVWIANIHTSYTTARAACIAEGANLYTFKTTEKANILQDLGQFLRGYYWIGLNKIENEVVYRWADDNTSLEMS
ncbi:unnamed protein product, partial [Lymnaea stagnalis]